MAKLTINGAVAEYEDGLKYEIVAMDYQKDFDDTIALTIVNGKITELCKPIKGDAEVSFITLKNSIGNKCYVRTATMIAMKACYDVLGKDNLARLVLDYAIGQGYYIDVKLNNGELTDEMVSKIKERMQEIVELDKPITKRAYPKEEAMKLFKELGMDDKLKLFRFRGSSSINVYCMDDFYDYYYGYMLPRAGYVKYFDLFKYESGIMLMLPKKETPTKLDFFEPREKLFNSMYTASSWGQMMGIENIGDLNEAVCDGSINDMILVAESLQERRISEIAKEIVDRGDVKFILIAGPSSSGKTSFSHRLSIQLRTYGKKPHPIGMDDYYVDREKTPRDADGNYDFECIEAIDTELFNKDMMRLLKGEEVDMPHFNFKTGKREYNGHTLKLGSEDILVIEGIHGLNPKTSELLPDDSKFKIFISALTTLNIDDHNRIPTTDARLLRRMVRDARTRGASAKQTISMWPSVRRGEEQYIFPYQETADVMFNSALIYELAALKTYAEPLLYNVYPGEPEYFEAKRLLKFLQYFVGIDPKDVPNNSLCREFVGGSYFNV